MLNPLQPVISAADSGRLPWLSNYVDSAKNRVAQLAFPNRKTEDWKYTSLKALQRGEFFARVNVASSTAQADSLEPEHSTLDLPCYTLAFVNGVFAPELSDNSQLPDGVELVTFSQASSTQQAVILEKLDSVCVPDQHLFAAVNSAQLSEGVFFSVKENIRLDKPVKLVYWNTQTEHLQTAQIRVFVDLANRSEATLIEHFVSGNNASSLLTNALTELSVGEGAQLNHYRLNLEDEQALHIGGVHTNLCRNAQLNSFYLAQGSELKRFDVVVNHIGEGAHCEMNGVYLPRNRQVVDFHTCIEHAVPHCTTNEVFRGIVADSARAVFNGRIHIHPNAQKTLAQLSNKNLLTSDKAEVDTKPELEIYADDVQCAHGATVAQLDESAMHYMLTRGVSAEEAKVMLSFGFINELIAEIKHPAVADYLRPLLAKMFARDERLMRHIA